MLAEELGVSPSAATEAVYLDLLGTDSSGTSSLGPPPSVPLPYALAPSGGPAVVGRDAESETLMAAYGRARAAGRQAVLVAGEPGVGKTTLVAEMARRAHADGARVLYGRCDQELGVAFQPFAQAVGGYVLHAPVEELAEHVGEFGGELARIAPALTRRLPAAPPPAVADAGSDRWRLFEAVGRHAGHGRTPRCGGTRPR